MNHYEHEAELYANARDAAAEAWRIAHKDAFRRMVDGIMGQYQGKLGEWNQRSEALARATADAAGFPSLSVWLNQRYPQRSAA